MVIAKDWGVFRLIFVFARLDQSRITQEIACSHCSLNHIFSHEIVVTSAHTDIRDARDLLAASTHDLAGIKWRLICLGFTQFLIGWFKSELIFTFRETTTTLTEGFWVASTQTFFYLFIACVAVVRKRRGSWKGIRRKITREGGERRGFSAFFLSFLPRAPKSPPPFPFNACHAG